MSNIQNSSLQNRIDNLAIAYVNAHYDISKMSATEYWKNVNTASKEIFEAMKNN